MNCVPLFRRMKFTFLPFLWLALALLTPLLASAQPQPVTVTVTADDAGKNLAPRFLGLSYEMSMLLPTDGHYYFDANDTALVNTFKTLGIKSLRVGANAVDDPRIPVPQEKDIDALFNFARAAGVKVIYSFRSEKWRSRRFRAAGQLHRGPRCGCARLFFHRQRAEFLSQNIYDIFCRNGSLTMTPF